MQPFVQRDEGQHQSADFESLKQSEKAVDVVFIEVGDEDQIYPGAPCGRGCAYHGDQIVDLRIAADVMPFQMSAAIEHPPEAFVAAIVWGDHPAREYSLAYGVEVVQHLESFHCVSVPAQFHGWLIADFARQDTTDSCWSNRLRCI